MSDLKIEAGKYYRTRDGRKAYVAAVLENPLGKLGTEHPALGYIGDLFCSWKLNGRVSFDPRPSDLIDEWREPREWTVTIAEGPNGVYSTKVWGMACDHKILARVTVREGEGLE